MLDLTVGSFSRVIRAPELLIPAEATGAWAHQADPPLPLVKSVVRTTIAVSKEAILVFGRDRIPDAIVDKFMVSHFVRYLSKV
jgi:hypothetical protein